MGDPQRAAGGRPLTVVPSSFAKRSVPWMHLLHEQSGVGWPASYDSYDSTTVKKIKGNTSRSTFMQDAVPPTVSSSSFPI